MSPAPSKTLAPIPADLVIEDGAFFAKAAADMLVAERNGIQLPDLSVMSIGEFVAAAAAGPQLSTQEKIRIVEQAILLFDKLYPHLPFKKQLYNFAHPVESLTAMLQALQTKGIDDADFHSQMVCCCSYVVDAHTVYGLPAPWRGSLAFLPFQMRCYRGSDQFPHFTVTRTMKAEGEGLPHPLFVPGAEIVYWNRSATDFVVENSHGRLPGGNYRARLSRGTFNATLRPLAYCELPDENVETLYYTPPGSTEMHAISFPWMVATGLEDTTGFPASTFSVSVPGAIASQSNQIMLHREEASAALGLGLFLVQPGAQSGSGSSAAAIDLQQTSALPQIFQFQYTDGAAGFGALNPDVLRDPGRPDAKFGYIRIASFGDASTGTDQIVNEFRRILRDVMTQKAPDGLVLDIRGNPGGDVTAAESMLQMLTSRTIVPVNFHLVNSAAMIGVLRRLRDARSGPQTPETEVLLENAADLQPWIDDVEVSAASQDVLTTGHPLTSPEQVNAIGRVYKGRCSLIVDALAYSAADIFAGGFQDNEIGPLLGADPNTGGGGANVWQHDDLRTKLPSTPDVNLEKLPGGVTLSLAIRRCTRVGINPGLAIEDSGVFADALFDPSSPGDLLNGFARIITSACRLMGCAASPGIEISGNILWRNGVVHIEFTPSLIDFVEFFVDGLNVSSATVQPGELQIFDLAQAAGTAKPGELRIDGYVSLPDGKGGTELLLADTSGPWGIVDASPTP